MIFHGLRGSNAFNPRSASCGDGGREQTRLLEIPHFSGRGWEKGWEAARRYKQPETESEPRAQRARQRCTFSLTLLALINQGETEHWIHDCTKRERERESTKGVGRARTPGYSLARSTGISASYSICGRFAPRRPLPPGQMISRWSCSLYGS